MEPVNLTSLINFVYLPLFCPKAERQCSQLLRPHSDKNLKQKFKQNTSVRMTKPSDTCYETSISRVCQLSLLMYSALSIVRKCLLTSGKKSKRDQNFSS